jgi:D-sedoheptulose 7-phosphate isomerase
MLHLPVRFVILPIFAAQNKGFALTKGEKKSNNGSQALRCQWRRKMNIIDSERIALRSRLLNDLNGDGRVAEAIGLLAGILKRGNRVMIFGNGGSATQSSHFAAELVNKFRLRRRALPALALASDMASVTSIANDESFATVFSRQVEAFGLRGDAALGLTTSGRSANVLQGLAKAREMGLATIALAGGNSEELRTIPVDVLIGVESDDTPLIQEMHLFLLHVMAEKIENDLFGGRHD